MCEAKKEKEFILFVSRFFSPSCSLILQLIFKYYCDLFITAQCSASQSYFQVDVFTGRRKGRHIDLYMGGVTLDFVTVLGGVPERASFCCCLKGSMTFCSSSPPGLKESGGWPGFIKLQVQFTKVLFEKTKRKGRVIYIIGSDADISWHCCVFQPDGANHGNLVWPAIP